MSEAYAAEMEQVGVVIERARKVGAWALARDACYQCSEPWVWMVGDEGEEKIGRDSGVVWPSCDAHLLDMVEIAEQWTDTNHENGYRPVNWGLQIEDRDGNHRTRWECCPCCYRGGRGHIEDQHDGPCDCHHTERLEDAS